MINKRTAYAIGLIGMALSPLGGIENKVEASDIATIHVAVRLAPEPGTVTLSSMTAPFYEDGKVERQINEELLDSRFAYPVTHLFPYEERD